MFSRRAGERAEQRAQGAIEDQKKESELSKNLAVLRGQQREDAAIRRMIDGKLSDPFGDEQSASNSEALQTPINIPTRSTAFFSVAEDAVQTLEDYV